jgi:hypothetical protein
MLSSSALVAQDHSMHGMPKPKPDMMMTGPLGISGDRQSSGTSWQPEAVPMPYRHAVIGKWGIMSHWNVFGQYDRQFGTRGRDQFGSINWSMVMASRPFAGGRLQLRAMNSLEALTVGRCGYPYLLQSGETCHGAPNADRQHPHDFFMEMAALYERALSETLAWSIYLAPAGEPAAGPAAFMHRPSAMNDPMSNITHHWQDATHITFGVVTAALYGRRWKLEGSAFNGREPDEHRWNFDLKNRRLSSFSGRLTVNPSAQWSVTGSHAYLEGVEPADPDESMHRSTASILHSRDLTNGRNLAWAVVWGANRHAGGEMEHSALAEANVEIDPKNALFLRAEHIAKSGQELVLSGPPAADHHPITGLSAGYVREIGALGVLSGGLGVRGSISLVPEALEPAYGSRTPAGLVVFLRIRPKRMTAAELAAIHERMMHAAMGMKMGQPE